jgi:hypothetical protein
MWLARLHPAKLLAGFLPSLIASVLLVTMSWSSAADPLGATPHNDGTTTFRVWAPFVDAVAVKINGGTPVPLAREAGHPDPADTLWAGTVSGAIAGDKYRYAIARGGVTREFNDPRAQQLTGFELPNGFGLAGTNDMPQSVIVDPNVISRRSPSPLSILWSYTRCTSVRSIKLSPAPSTNWTT